MRKDFKQFFRELIEQGYEVCRASKHIKIVSPIGEIFYTSSTPSDYRALKNLKNDIKKGRPRNKYKGEANDKNK